MTTNDGSTVTGSDVGPASDAANGSGAAARLLEIAARNADELLEEARAEADELTRAAREEADRLVTTARSEAQQLRADLEEERARRSAEIARLQQMEEDHRERVRRQLKDLLAQIEGPPPS